MALKCAFCEKSAIVICHHCSKPLCVEHRHIVTNDWVFVEPQRRFPWHLLPALDRRTPSEPAQEALAAQGAEATKVLEANHCKACKRKYHRARFWLNLLLPNL